MKRSRLLATLLTTLLLVVLTSVTTTTTAQASACDAPPCGMVVNNSGWDLQIRYKNSDSGPWIQETLRNGHKRGGWLNDGVDVDQVYIPLGCVATVRITLLSGVSHSMYWPANWDKLGSDQIAEVTGILCQDGYVYAWDNIWNDDNYANFSCRWYNDDSTWGDDCGNFRNRASAVQNNSAHGNAINFYFHPGYTGAWGCLGPGSVWRDLRYNYFSWGPGLDGYNNAMNDEIASSKWVRSCGN